MVLTICDGLSCSELDSGVVDGQEKPKESKHTGSDTSDREEGEAKNSEGTHLSTADKKQLTRRQYHGSHSGTSEPRKTNLPREPKTANSLTKSLPSLQPNILVLDHNSPRHCSRNLSLHNPRRRLPPSLLEISARLTLRPLPTRL